MKKLFFFSCIVYSIPLFAQVCPNTPWVWIHGEKVCTSPNNISVGNEGTINIPSPNNMPSGRAFFSKTVDKNGDIWIFGGVAQRTTNKNTLEAGAVNDLWRFEVSKNIWTRFSGTAAKIDSAVHYGTLNVPDAKSNPGGRYNANIWFDNAGNLWLYSGVGKDAWAPWHFSDIWMFDFKTSLWTWKAGPQGQLPNGNWSVKGQFSSAVYPSFRIGAATWRDKSGNFWLFGGDVNIEVNDLWQFDPTKNQWRWVNGTDGKKNPTPKNYGKRSVASNFNWPYGREGASSMSDLAGNFWMFGGHGYNGIEDGLLNDVWKFDPQSEQWTWMSGDSLYGNKAFYITKGVEGTTNTPGESWYAEDLSVLDNKFWIYSGSGVWSFNIGTQNWALMKGDSGDAFQPVIQPNKNQITATATPGWRPTAAGFNDGKNLYMFGGNAFCTSPNDVIYSNDLWKLSFDDYSIAFGYFTGTVISSDVLLNWSTLKEAGNFKFFIERSFERKNFVPLTSVTAGGNPAGAAYSYTDVDPWQNHDSVFYRMNISDLQQCNVRYDTIKVQRTTADMWIAPNPADVEVSLYVNSAADDTGIVRLISSSGVILQAKRVKLKKGLQQIPFNIRFYASANYFMEVVLTKRRKTFKFIKHN